MRALRQAVVGVALMAAAAGATAERGSVTIGWSAPVAEAHADEGALSNAEVSLAEEVGAAWRRYTQLNREAIEAYLEAGRVLSAGKAACRRGAWSAFLARAGIPGRPAQRAMRLYAAGLSPDDVAGRGVEHVLGLARERRRGIQGSLAAAGFDAGPPRVRCARRPGAHPHTARPQ